VRKLDPRALICGFVCVILLLAVLIEHRLVTDGQMNSQTDRQTNKGHRATAHTALA